MSTTPEVTITATAHTGCDECDGCAESARIYIRAGGSRTEGRFGSSAVKGGPHWATFTTEPAPALAAEATERARDRADDVLHEQKRRRMLDAAGSVVAETRSLMRRANEAQHPPRVRAEDVGELRDLVAVLRVRVNAFEREVDRLVGIGPDPQRAPIGEGNSQPGVEDGSGVAVLGKDGVDAGGVLSDCLLGVAVVLAPEEGDTAVGKRFTFSVDVHSADVAQPRDAFLKICRDAVDVVSERGVEFEPLSLMDEENGLAHDASPSAGEGAEPGQASTASVEGEPATGGPFQESPVALTPSKHGREINPAALRSIRELAGVRSGLLAQAAGISHSFLSNIEAGRKQPSPAVTHQLARRLGVPIDAITQTA